MFRARVAAQAFTIVAMVAGGVYFSEDRKRSKEMREAKKAAEEEEKRTKWLRELEARDKEDSERKAIVAERKRLAAGGEVQKPSVSSEAQKLLDAKRDSAELAQIDQRMGELEAGAAQKNASGRTSWRSWFGGSGTPSDPPASKGADSTDSKPR